MGRGISPAELYRLEKQKREALGARGLLPPRIPRRPHSGVTRNQQPSGATKRAGRKITKTCKDRTCHDCNCLRAA